MNFKITTMYLIPRDKADEDSDITYNLQGSANTPDLIENKMSTL